MRARQAKRAKLNAQTSTLAMSVNPATMRSRFRFASPPAVRWPGVVEESFPRLPALPEPLLARAPADTSRPFRAQTPSPWVTGNPSQAASRSTLRQLQQASPSLPFVTESSVFPVSSLHPDWRRTTPGRRLTLPTRTSALTVWAIATDLLPLLFPAFRPTPKTLLAAKSSL